MDDRRTRSVERRTEHVEQLPQPRRRCRGAADRLQLPGGLLVLDHRPELGNDRRLRQRLPRDSENLEDGLEPSDERQPVNEGKVVANATWTNHTIQNWNFDELEAKNWSGEPTSHICLSHYVNIPGDINYGTC